MMNPIRLACEVFFRRTSAHTLRRTLRRRGIVPIPPPAPKDLPDSARCKHGDRKGAAEK